MKYDLHIHSNCSDGKYSKLQLLKYFNENGFEVVSFADYNFIEEKTNDEINDEYFKTYNEKQQVEIIPAIEFDVSENESLHILGYGIQDIQKVKKELNIINEENYYRIYRNLENIYMTYGISIDIDELQEKSENGILSKRDITKWIVENEYAEDYKEAEDLYTSKESPCYVKKVTFSTKKTINLIKENGGYAVLAHPFSMQYEKEELETFVKELINLGLDGIEINNLDKTTPEQIEYLKNLANKLNLLKTCGSDFHNEVNTPKLGLEDSESTEFIKILRR